MRQLVWVGLVMSLWMPRAWAGTACFEQTTGQWLGEYCSSCEPGICVKNWVTNNPQFGYTADQIEERMVTSAEGKVLQETWEDDDRNPYKAVQRAKQVAEVKRQTARDSGGA